MGCPQCEHLQSKFNAVIRRNRALLDELETAMMDLNHAEIERLRLALLDIEESRRETRIALLAHDATHRVKAATA